MDAIVPIRLKEILLVSRRGEPTVMAS